MPRVKIETGLNISSVVEFERVRFLAKIHHTTKVFFKVPTRNVSSSKIGHNFSSRVESRVLFQNDTSYIHGLRPWRKLQKVQN